MPDDLTKKKIKDLNDILVGIVPDPKGRVDQITLAMMYKFMDELDDLSRSSGSKFLYFQKKYEKYSWSNLFDPKLSGFEFLERYKESIEKIGENENIPTLFREIFKDAKSSIEDPAVLKIFLKKINDFDYKNSETLGDSFENLLSFVSSQAEAGQFRTPRHIIDFMVEIINPQKNESLLDPASGTGGFLISSFKHILKENTKNTEGDLISSSDRKFLNDNYCGYDIDPGMTRLGLVNMYFHKFSNPKIYQHNTLSSKERWNEYFDIVLANPPFMTPKKAGIQPHKDFSIDSKKAEVLFSSYIFDHIKPSGRGAIIVPEGIIFQTGKAYKQLRKQLIEGGLLGVISLPQGVFNPYSGVKTSILLIDKKNHSKHDNIFFAEVENDGFSLGSKRKEVEENDLPKIKNEINLFLRGGKNNLNLIEKETILKNEDLSLNYYIYFTDYKNYSDYPFVDLDDKRYFKVVAGGTPLSYEQTFWDGNVNWISLVDLDSDELVNEIESSERKITELGLKNSSAVLIPKDSIVVSTRATIGRVGVTKIPLATNQGFKNIIIQDPSKTLPKYVANMILKLRDHMSKISTGSTYKELSKKNFSRLSIPLPPIEIQKKLVEQIEREKLTLLESEENIELSKKKISTSINDIWGF